MSKSILEELSQTALFEKIGIVCTAVTEVISAQELLERSLRSTMDLFSASRGSIYIVSENGKNLTLKTALGMEVAEQRELVKRLGQGIVGRVAQIKKPVVVDDITTDSRFKNYKSRTSYSTSSFICAPLMIKDKLIGVINITDKRDHERFTRDELQLLDFVSSQIALNYRRVQLYQKFKKVVRESKTLKTQLGKSSKETTDLKHKIVQQEKLATIGKLAGGIAHEFNNPLDGVLRYTNLCLDQVKDDEVVRGYLIEIKHGLNRMVNIVKSLLACSRNVSPTLQKVDPNILIEQAVSDVNSDAFHKNVSIEKKLQADLPLLIDHGLERALSNLLRNAIDAVGQGGKIRIASRIKGDMVVISVQDSGCGMSKDVREKIFDPFFTTKNMDKGCGLGLTIVSEIIKSYDGQIEIESAPKKGTTFTVYLPVKNHE